MVDRVDQVPKFQGPVAAALQRRRQHDPGGRVRVLAAVLADARHVALDVARLQRALVERRVEELDQLVVGRAPDAARPRPSPVGPAPGRAAPEITAQACGIASIWHSSFWAEPSGVPSSK